MPVTGCRWPVFLGALHEHSVVVALTMGVFCTMPNSLLTNWQKGTAFAAGYAPA